MFFFFNDTATTEIYTLSLHDALPISLGRGRPQGHPQILRGVAGQPVVRQGRADHPARPADFERPEPLLERDRKSTRLNSSHGYISYAVFCLKKKTWKNG